MFSARMGPAPDFGLYLWRNDPKGLEMVESHHLSPRSFLTITPLVQNAGRVYLLTGRAQKLSAIYLSLDTGPEQFAALYDDREDFLSTAPLIGLACSEPDTPPRHKRCSRLPKRAARIS